MGAMIRSRSSLLATGSPVARSAQASINHSIATAAHRARPATNTAVCSTRPSAIVAAPNAPTTGQKLSVTRGADATVSTPR